MKKSFSQHLLKDKDFLRRIINSADLKPDDIVFEIGAGTGMLTIEAAKKVKKVYAVEMEREIIKKLKGNIKFNNIQNVEIVEKNILNLNFKDYNCKKFKIIGNIPYNITSKILFKLFGEIDKPSSYISCFNKIYLMLQKEVAKRLTAKPSTKAYSPLSLSVQYFADVEILFEVPRQAFYPAPDVDSAFVSFTVRKNLTKIQDPVMFTNVVRTAFQQRRKKIINSLQTLFRDKHKLSECLRKLNIDENSRAENLSFNDFLFLACELNVSN